MHSVGCPALASFPLLSLFETPVCWVLSTTKTAARSSESYIAIKQNTATLMGSLPIEIVAGSTTLQLVRTSKLSLQGAA